MSPRGDYDGTPPPPVVMRMMMNKRVHALVDLLSAASMDTIDNGYLEREAQRCTLELRSTTHPKLPDEPQVLDRQIEKMIRQLRESVRDAPERSAREGGVDPDIEEEINNLPQERPPEPSAATPEPPSKGQIEPSDEDRREYLEREMSTTSYPKIGPGYSDSISVVSDLTIPTVVTGVTVPEEEHYDGPPLQIDCSKKAKPVIHRPPVQIQPKKPNRPNLSNRSSLRPPSRRHVVHRSPPQQRTGGGAAQSRMQTYQNTMARLERSAGPSSPTPPSKPSTSPTPTPPPPSSRSPERIQSVSDFPSLKETKEKKRRRHTRPNNQVYMEEMRKHRANIAREASQRYRRNKGGSGSNGGSGSGNGGGDASAENPMMDHALKDVGKDVGNLFAGLDQESSAGASGSSAPVIIDEDGFIINTDKTRRSGGGGGANHHAPDLFATSSSKKSDPFAVTKDFTKFDSNFFPASSRDTKSKRSSKGRRSSTGMPSPPPRVGRRSSSHNANSSSSNSGSLGGSSGGRRR